MYQCDGVYVPAPVRSSAGAGEPTCDQPSAKSIDVSSTSRATGTLGTTAGLEGQEEITTLFLKWVAERATKFGVSEGLGWLLPLITGQQNLDPTQINQQFEGVNGKLDSLAQYVDCQVLLTALKHATDTAAHTNLAAGMADQIGLLETF